MPGQCGRTRLTPTMIAAQPNPSASAAGLAVGAAAARAASFGRNGPGSWATARPNRSLIWLAAMVTAMPAVNPTVTACGISRI